MTVVTKDYVFIHVPKVAGRSITKVLGGETLGVPTHLPCSELGNLGLDRRFSFGFARNPWDRMVSAYTFLCQKKLQPHECPQYQRKIRDIGFKAWLLRDRFYMQQDENWRSEHLAPLQTRPQLFWLEGCDFIGKIETIDIDFQAIRTRLGIRPTLLERLGIVNRVPKKNHTKRAGYQSYYDNETVDFVAHHFRSDIDAFGYAFGQ